MLLPPSVGHALMAQDASRNGAMLFEIALPACASVPSLPTPAATPGSAPVAADGGVLLPPPYTSAPAATSTTSAQQQQQQQPPLPPGCPGRTHAGVLEFTAPEGTVLLPRKVVQSLYGSLEAQPLGTVVVSYKRLEKGSYVRLQPMSHGFHEAMSQPDVAGEAEGGLQQEAGAGGGGQQGEGEGEGAGGWGLREVLERELLAHSTLSEGDWLTVTHGGKEWPLRVSAGAAGRAGEALLMVQTGMLVTALLMLGEHLDIRWPVHQMHTSPHARHWYLCIGRCAAVSPATATCLTCSHLPTARTRAGPGAASLQRRVHHRHGR